MTGRLVGDRDRLFYEFELDAVVWQTIRLKLPDWFVDDGG